MTVKSEKIRIQRLLAQSPQQRQLLSLDGA
jgi:hypothetical protein